LISIGKKKTEEEANNLIKIKVEYCVDLYLLINPLLFWLDFSVEREERFSLFKVITNYQRCSRTFHKKVI
jgi:hypothetical protein